MLPANRTSLKTLSTKMKSRVLSCPSLLKPIDASMTEARRAAAITIKSNLKIYRKTK